MTLSLWNPLVYYNYLPSTFRYSNTIAAHFLAHTHFDHFELFYDPATHKPVSVGYIAPSVTTYAGDKGINPGYRIYTVDGYYTNSTWVCYYNVTLPILPGYVITM